MKKGFTLVEVLAVIVLTSLIMFIAIPAIINTVNKKRNTISNDAKKIIYDASDLYVSNYINAMQSGTTYCITLNDLVEKGYLTSPVMDYKNDKEVPLNYFVMVTPSGNEYNYELVNNCTYTTLNDSITN